MLYLFMLSPGKECYFLGAQDTVLWKNQSLTLYSGNLEPRENTSSNKTNCVSQCKIVGVESYMRRIPSKQEPSQGALTWPGKSGKLSWEEAIWAKVWKNEMEFQDEKTLW